VDRIKGVGDLRPDELAKGDTNIICCGNKKCGGADLGSLLERFTQGGPTVE
jgi:hypothetical protein